MEIINGVDQDDVGGGDCTDIDGATIDSSVIGGTIPAAGSFTTLEASTDPVDADGVGDREFNDGRYCLEANNLSDVDNTATAFGNIKQAATDSATGVSELATNTEAVTGTATDRVITPANIVATLAAPGAIGGTTPATGVFTTLEATGQLQGALINNQMVQKVTFDILGLMTDPRLLNLQCEDPGAGIMTDASGQGHDGTYQGSMTTGDRVKKGMGWLLDFDGTNDYISFVDHNDFSFGNGINDEQYTWFTVVEIIDSIIYQKIFSKNNAQTGSQSREYFLDITDSRKIRVYQQDESSNKLCTRITDVALTSGFHSVTITSPGDGGATAMNNVKIYVDGELVASTATNDAEYVAMENTSTPFLIGALYGVSGTPEKYMEGDIALLGLDGSEWSAYDVHRFHQLCKGLYGL
jgi:hypothetical protein